MAAEFPLFSIITPTNNRPQLLKRCMRSVSEQTFRNFEHIIVDNGSNKHTLQIVNENKNQHTIFLRHENSKGVAASYNFGINNARGEYIFFLDDDDEAMPTLLEKLNNAFLLKGKDIGFILTGIERVVDKKLGIEKEYIVVWPEKFRNREEALIAATSVGNVGVCIRKGCFTGIGLYDEEICFAEDTDLIFRLLKSYDFFAIRDVLVRKHKHAAFQLTCDDNFSDRIKGTRVILDRYKEIIGSLPKLHSVHHSSYAYLCYKSSFRKEGRKVMFDVIEKNPLRVKSYFDLISLEILGTHAGGTFIGKLFKKLKAVSN